MNLLAAIVVVTNLGFTAGFDTDRRQPVWVAYDLEPSEVVVTNRAPYAFKADPRIAGSDVSSVYRELSFAFDRGHLAPAADFNWSPEALKETYYFSNVCPMLKRANRGKWAKAEAEVRSLAASGTVHVVTFPVYGGCYHLGVGKPVELPYKFVKVAYGWFGIRFWEVENYETHEAVPL